MTDKVRVWFDVQPDYLEVRIRDGAGDLKETAHDAVMDRVDAQGRVLGLSVQGVSRFTKDKPLQVALLLV